MKSNKPNFKIVLGLVLITLFALPVTVYADDGGPKGDQIIFGRNFTLKSNETLDGNLAVMAGTVTLEDDSLVTGDIFVAGGAIWIYGEVDGSLVTMGGGIYLGENAVVKKDVVVMGGAFNRADGAIVGGQVISSIPSGTKLFSSPALSGIHVPRFWVDMNPLWNIPKGLFESLIWAILGALLVLFLPVPTERVAKAIVSQPALAGGFGLLTVVILPFVSIILLITLILIPLIPLVLLVLVFALIFGWISIGYEVGRRLAEQFHVQWAMPVSAGIGILLVTIVAKAIGSIACIGWIVPFILLMLGLGGVIITRFGSQNYIATSSPQTIPTPPEPPAPPDAPISSKVSESNSAKDPTSAGSTIAANDRSKGELKQNELKDIQVGSRKVSREPQSKKGLSEKSRKSKNNGQSDAEKQLDTPVKKSATSRRKKSE